MAADINNVTGGVAGNQKLGNITVSTGGQTPKNSTTHDVELLDISGISQKYTDRWDDPTYY